jgi:glycosyltransferase involved in cell wall biosynthesis
MSSNQAEDIAEHDGDLSLNNVAALVAMHVIQISETESSYGPPIALTEFLKKKTQSYAVISHPFSWSYPSPSTVEWIQQGKAVRKITLPNFRLPEPAAYLRDLVVGICAVLLLQLRVELYVGADGINTLAGLVLRKLGRAKTVVYYSIDYTPSRFHNPLLNGVYHALDRFCAKRSDYVWNLSSRMANVRRKQGVEDTRNLVVPVGTSPRRVNPNLGREEKNIVFLSHLTPSKGVEIVLDAMPIVLARLPKVKLVIIGHGPYEHRIKEIISERKLESNVFLYGPMNHEMILGTLPSFAVGLAPYRPSPDSITWYADPTKIKDYLSCGLPVIVTNVPEVASEVEKKRAGMIVEYSAEDLADAVIKLLGSSELEQFQRNAYSMALEYDWSRLFSRTIELCKT